MTAESARDTRTHKGQRRTRLLAGGASLAAHALALMLVLVSIRPTPPPAPPPITVVPVELVQPPKIQAPPSPTPAAAPANPSPAKKTPRKPPPKPGHVHPSKLPAPAELAAGEGDEPGVSDADLAGAAVAGRGGGGGSCDMLSRLQAALRKDPLVAQMAAEAQPAGRAILVWNGDWVRNGGQDGKGLSAVREAILWTVGFAPAACRAQEVKGLVLVTLNSTPGSARLVLGTGRWRWSDLLQLHH